MDYTREDYRDLYNDPDSPWADLTTGQKLCMVALVAAILATGLVEHDSVSVMQEVEDRRLVDLGLCPKHNAEGEILSSSMIQATYIKGAPQFHECRYRSE